MPPEKKLPRNIWILTIGSFLTDISSEMIVYLIPLFLANVLGVQTAAIGLIEGVAETTASLLKLISGRLSDWLGQRKSLTVGGYALSTLAKPFLVLANSWTAVLLVRFTDRVGKGIRTAPRDALIADSIEPERRGWAFGIHRAGDTFGAALGLIIAFTVVWLTQGNALTLEANTFHRLVWLSFIPAALAVVALAFGLQEKKGVIGAPGTTGPWGWQELGRPFKGFLLLVLLFTLGNSSDAFLVLRAQERGQSVLGVMGMLITFNLVYAFVSSPASTLSDKIGRKRLLVAGWLLYAFIYAGFAFAQTSGQVWVLFGLYGIYYGLTEGSAKAFVADLVPANQRGTAYGLFNAAVGLAALPASLIAGLLWQGAGRWAGFGAQAPFAWGAALALCAALGLIFSQLTVNREK